MHLPVSHCATGPDRFDSRCALPDKFCRLFCDQKGAKNDEVAEWLRRWTANPLCSARVGSNPILVAAGMATSLLPLWVIKSPAIINGKLHSHAGETTHMMPVLLAARNQQQSFPTMYTASNQLSPNTSAQTSRAIPLDRTQLSTLARWIQVSPVQRASFSDWGQGGPTPLKGLFKRPSVSIWNGTGGLRHRRPTMQF